MSIFKRVCNIIYELDEVNEKILDEETNLSDDLELDSISFLHLQIMIEDEFGFQFDAIDDDFELIFNTVKSLCDFIEGKCKNE